MRKPIITLLLLALVSHCFAAEITDSVPENTTIVIRADWQQLRNSIIATEIIDNNLEQFNSAMEGIKTATGVDLDNVQRVWLLAEKENTGAIILEGDVNTETIRAQIGKNAEVEFGDKEGFDLYAEYVEHKDPKILAVNESIAIAGNRDYTLKLLEVMANSANSITDSPALATLAADKHTVAVAMLRVNEEIRSKNPDIAALLKYGNLGITVSDTVSAKLSLETNAADQAEGLHMMAQGMIALQGAKLQQMAANSDQYPAQKVREATVLSSMMKTLKITRDGTNVSAAWNLSEDAHKLIKEALAAKAEGETPIAVPGL